ARESLELDTGTFFHTIKGTMEHIALAELLWLKRFSSFGKFASLENNKYLTSEPGKVEKDIVEKIENCLVILEDLDELLIKLIDELSEEALQSVVRYKNTKGDAFEKIYYQTILHVLVHGIHHQGELSAMMDILKIKNDFSGFTSYKYN
ncbi:MAG: hypothetical protein CVV53_07260, partial [Spirochaetae bacterium HGW-Spirochaetae-9]